MDIKWSNFANKELLSFIFKIVFIGIIVFIISNYLFQLCVIRGDSMYPTLKNGQLIIAQKFNLNLQYGDIVVIYKNEKKIIKRVVGMPGDFIKIDGYLYINGQISDNYLFDDTEPEIEEFKLNEDEFFVLGDNVNNSTDSRFEEIGIIYRDEIKGKMIFNNNNNWRKK